MTETVDIVREDGETRGRYVVRLADGLEAELTYGRRDRVLVADHTFVPPAHRGRGIAEQLVDALIADARAENLCIHPTCSYVATQFRRHPEWADLRA